MVLRRAALALLALLAAAPAWAQSANVALSVHQAVSAACGGCILGVSIGNPNDETTWTLQYASGATAAQQQQAQAAVAAKTPAQWQALALAPVEMQIVSTSTPALNATYAIDDAAATAIDGIYAGIRGGDGLPGNGGTFNYLDKAGAAHSFSATEFAAFAKSVRDYRYALSQGQAPAQPVTIP